jgi:hypothetical protein
VKEADATPRVNANDPALTGRFANRTRFVRAIAAWTYGYRGLANRLAFAGLDSLFSFEVGADRYVRLKTDSATSCAGGSASA